MERKPRTRGSGASAAATPGELRSARPWHSFAVKYYEAGWCPLPLPARKKSNPPTGTTGKYGMPDKATLTKWLKQYDPKGNIALRMPDNVIGIDVDAYDNKVGRASLAELIADLGPLPDTWILTSRTDGISGIRFYQVPEGLHYSGQPIADIQIVQHHHRYAVAYPSIHPDTKSIYKWYPPGDLLDGRPAVTVDTELPSLKDLPMLPASWVEGLTGGRTWAALPTDAAASRSELIEWLKSRPAGEMCRLMAKEAARAVDEIAVGGAHDALNSRLYSVISLSTEGHVGIIRALKEMRAAFNAEVTAVGRKGRRTQREATAEFNRARDGAIRIMLGSIRDGESILENECGCAESSLNWGEKLGVQVEEQGEERLKRRARLGRAKPADKYPLDDSGNAEHLLDILDGSAYYVAGEKVWNFWSPKDGCWAGDAQNSRILQAAQLVAKRQRELADEYNEKLISIGNGGGKDLGGDVTGRISALLKAAKSGSAYSGLINMTKVAQAQQRAEKAAEEFDVDSRLLACPNGTVVLDPDNGLSFRPAGRGDFCSMTTGVEFDPGAKAAEWDAYLKRFIPDRTIRSWVQRVVGYSLIGGNPERLMIFVVGGTSTGKTTFINAINAALGGYAGTMNLSLFRDNQDEKPRADLVRSLARRLLTASEASAEWFLHGDQIKRLTGGDPIKARLLYSSTYVERIPAFTPWVATNAMPQIHGADLALRRRLVQVPFVNAVSLGDEDYRAGAALSAVPEVRSAVLAWAVRGWERYRALGIRDLPGSVAAATAEMHAGLSDLDVFLADTVKFDAISLERGRGWLVFSDLFERWRMWCMDNNVRDDMSSNRFGRELTARGFKSDIRKVNGEVTRIRTGLDWAD